MEYAEIKKLVASGLVAAGWTEPGYAAVGSKMFETAVGPREALAYLSHGDEYNRTLFGTYYSEGNNALSSHSVLLPLDASTETVVKLVADFASNADIVVSKTYAAHLLKVL
jgi:hypothetical protein